MKINIETNIMQLVPVYIQTYYFNVLYSHREIIFNPINSLRDFGPPAEPLPPHLFKLYKSSLSTFDFQIYVSTKKRHLVKLSFTSFIFTSNLIIALIVNASFIFVSKH